MKSVDLARDFQVLRRRIDAEQDREKRRRMLRCWQVMFDLTKE